MARQTPEQIRARAAALLQNQDAALAAHDADPRHSTTRVRTDDHATSEEGGRAVGARAPNQRLLLLLQWRQADEDGLTDEEAGERAGLLGSCHWKRAGELRAEGWIAWDVDHKTRKGHAGVSRKISHITDEGKAALIRREIR